MVISIFFFIVAYLAGRVIIKLSKLNLENIIHPASMVLGLVFFCVLFYVEGLVFGSLKEFTSLITLFGLMIIAGVVLRKSFDSLRSLRMTNKLGRLLRLFVPRNDPLSSRLQRAKQIKIPAFAGMTKEMEMTGLIITFLFIIFIIWFFGRSLFFGTSGEIIAGDRLVWTDWPLHIGMAANFAFGANFPAQNPHFSGIPLTYPFMSDLLSGILLSLGVDLPMSFVIPGIVLTLSFFWIFVEWGKSLGLLMSLKQAYRALIISLLWGGLGWIFWLKDVFANETQMIENLLFPPHEYTFWSEKGQWFFTFIYSEILPQRAFLFGLPMFFLILYLVKKGWEKHENKYLFTAGILGGLLPFFHTHTFISLWILSGSVVAIGLVSVIASRAKPSFAKNKEDRHPSTSGNSIRNIPSLREYKRDDKVKLIIKALISYFTPLIILSLIQLPFFSSKSLLNIPFAFGWMKENRNFFVFWAMNTGLFIPLWWLGFWKGKFSTFSKILGLASWSLFIIPNLFQFAPWGYDNLKIFTFWYVIGSVFVVAGLKYISQIKFIGRICAILLFISLILSGVLEVSRLFHTSKTQITLWGKPDQELAEIIRQKTPPQSVFLTAAIHDHPVEVLAGRKIIIGFPGNSWSWGIEGWDIREKDVHTMLQGGDQAKLLWKKYAINYIIVSDRERWFEPKLDEEFIVENATLLFTQNNTKVYKVN